MAELTNKLHIKLEASVFDCTCYTTTDEATPKTVSNGSYWEIKNNNTVCYLGLVPSASADTTGFDTPLKVKKNNTEYIVQAQVRNYFTVNIKQSANQTITVTCGGNEYTSSFTALAGSYYTVRVTPSTGYTAGTPNTTSGYVNSNISISASAATKATYLFTIIKTSNQTIIVDYAKKYSYTSKASSNTTFTVTYGETWSATIEEDDGYNPGTLSATSGTITGNVTISATAATIKTFTLSFGATTNQTYVATIGGTTKAATSRATSYTVNYGTSYSVSYIAANATAAYSYTASSSVSGTVTSNVSVPAKTATANLRYYLLKVPAVSNQYYFLRLAESDYGGTLPDYNGEVTQAAQNSGNGLSVPYGTPYRIIYVNPSDGYNAGEFQYGTVTADTIITHNAATLKTYTLTLNTVENGYWKVNGVTKAAGSYTYSHGTSLTVECFANDGYVKPTELTMS